MSWTLTRMRFPPRWTLPSRTYRTFSSRPIVFTSSGLPLYANAVLRAITTARRIREGSVVRLSVTPSTKCSCSGSSPILANGKTTIEADSNRGYKESDNARGRVDPHGSEPFRQLSRIGEAEIGDEHCREYCRHNGDKGKDFS